MVIDRLFIRLSNYNWAENVFVVYSFADEVRVDSPQSTLFLFR